MASNNGNGNLLCELAKAMPARERHLTAMALRRLAKHGYTSLAEVEKATDWELLAIDGIGLSRLAAIRHLTWPGWRLPSRRAILTAGRLLSTARLALRFWSIEDLEAALTGAEPVVRENRPAETRLSMEAFTGAAREASDHHEPDVIRHIVQRASLLTGHGKGNGRTHDQI